MPIKNYKPEQIVPMLRQIEVQMANGKPTPQACKEAGIHTQTYYRWRKEYGGLKVEQAKRMKVLEKENTRLQAVGRRTVAGETSLEGGGGGKLLSPERRRCAVRRAEREYGMSERHACRLLGQGRGTQRYERIVKGGVKLDHSGGEKVDQFRGGGSFDLRELRGRLERKPATPAGRRG